MQEWAGSGNFARMYFTNKCFSKLCMINFITQFSNPYISSFNELQFPRMRAHWFGIELV